MSDEQSKPPEPTSAHEGVSGSGSSAGYAAIPVSVARVIGEDYRKDCVVILAYDHESQKTHATTWGREPADKAGAVAVRDKCLEAICVDMTGGTTYQDYRFLPEGERAKIVDGLIKSCRELLAATNPLTGPPDDMDKIRKRAYAAIEAA